MPLAEVLIGLIGQEVAPLALLATMVIPTSTGDLDGWERRIEQGVAGDTSIAETDRLAIIRARKGQADHFSGRAPTLAAANGYRYDYGGQCLDFHRNDVLL